VIEKQHRRRPIRATNSTPRPGDFPLGSGRSRAAARALLEERVRPKDPPIEVNLSFLSVEEAQEIYAKLAALPKIRPIGNDAPYFHIRWPEGFTPGGREKPLSRGQNRESL
jgi:hypothetical protein